MFRKIITFMLIIFLVSIISLTGLSKTFELKVQALSLGSPQRTATDIFFELVNKKLTEEESEHEINVRYFLEGEIFVPQKLLMP